MPRLWIAFSGFCMGAADLVPGVSGGTMAFVLGIYEPLIDNIKSVRFGALRKAAWPFLLTLLAGMLTAIFLLAKPIHAILSTPAGCTALYAAFTGFILASCHFCSKQLDRWHLKVFFFLVAGAAIAIVLTTWPKAQTTAKERFDVPYQTSWNVPLANVKEGFIEGVSEAEIATMLAKGTLASETPIRHTQTGEWKAASMWVSAHHQPLFDGWLIFCGIIGISAMLLPGISGSYLLAILGAYTTVIAALADLTSTGWDRDAALVLFNLGLGILIGLALFSRVVSWLLHHYHNSTLATLIGFMIGALPTVWPFWRYEWILDPLKITKGPQLQLLDRVLWSSDTKLLIISLICLIGGALFVTALEWVAARQLK